MNFCKKRIILILLFCTINTVFAQDNWVSYSKAINTKEYIGCKFRLTAFIKTELIDDSASAKLWARTDKEKGTAFFYDMWDKPVRSKDWGSYSMEGKIDSGVYQLAFGALCEFNGKFFYKDIKLDIEKSKDKYENVFNSNFENGITQFEEGIQYLKSGFNKNYTAKILNTDKKSKVLLIEGEDVPNYGMNNKVGKFAYVNGIKLYYEIYGTGPPLLILHGNGGSIQNAIPFYPDLIKKYKVITVDSRSQGKSTTTNEPLSYDLMASDVNTLLNQLNIDSANIWGQSDGAIIALLLAKDYPKKVRRALAYSPNIQPDSLAIFPWALEAMNKIVIETNNTKQKALNLLMLQYPNFQFSELLKIKAPIMLMSGDRDLIRLEHILKIFQNIPNSQLCILPGASHVGSWEHKELFLTLMNNFFNKPFKMPDTKSWFVH